MLPPKKTIFRSWIMKSLFAFVLVCLLSSYYSVVAQPKNELQKAVLDELNLLRSNPAAYSKYLENMRAGYEKLNTFEGLPALVEAIITLKATEPLNNVEWSEGLFKVADAHATDVANTGNFSHTGSDGSSLLQRVARVGSYRGYIGEAITTYDESARVIIIQWLIDDGNQRRGHRKIMLHPLITISGISTKISSKHGFYCVLVASGGFQENVSSASKTNATTTTTTTTATTDSLTNKTSTNTTKPKPKKITKKP